MAKIYIHDEFGPEATAMMQALYSRSPESVERHVERVQKTGSAKFMRNYYVGYGHASIGDCGTTTIFFEKVSILAAKAIQDNPLYSGQETSTRYIDFSAQPLFDPVGNPESQRILEEWISFYTKTTPLIREHLRASFPPEPDQPDAVWEKAINARSFDILRGYLPAAATTQLSWSTNLRQAHDKLTLLRHHPLIEVQELAATTLKLLKEKYPSSFSHSEKIEHDLYYREHAFAINYSDYDYANMSENDLIVESDIDNRELEKFALPEISRRPRGARLPRYLTQFGRFNCRFLLDYGSFRDLQRHRNGLCRIPLLGTKYNFGHWYRSQLPESAALLVDELLTTQRERIEKLRVKCELTDVELQYYLPMGTNVACQLVYDLPEMVYVTELRSSSTVHPTLRRVAHNLHFVLTERHPALKLYTDLEPDSFEIRRGFQDIVHRNDI